MNPATSSAQAQSSADQYATLKSAVLGTSTNAAPGASVLGPTPELDQLYGGTVQLAKSQLGNASPNANTVIQAKATAQAQADAQALAAQKLKDLQDPSKYQQVQKNDGGYAFYDPSGHEISAAQFAAVHNTTPNDVLKHSQNPIDIAYQQDFNNLQAYMNAKLRSGNDQKQADIAKGIEDSVRQTTGLNIAKMNPQQLIQQFQAAYPTVYGGTGRGVPASATFIPNGNDIYNGG